MLTTTNYRLKKPEGTDVVDIQNFNDNADIIDQTLKKHDTELSDMVYQTAGGSATAITLIIKGTLVNGYPITFIANVNNGGAVTTINGKKLYKPGTTTSPNLIKDKAYTVWYNSIGDCFFIKASAEGDADVSHVLATKKFSNDNDTGLVGTMPNNNIPSTNLQINGTYTIPKGYHPGTEIVTQNIPTKDGATIMPGTTNQIISANIYTTGIQTILGDVNLIPESILSGRSIFNVIGTAILAYSANGNLITNVQSVGTEVSVITLGFIPDFVTVWNDAGNHRSIYESKNFQGSTYASLPVYLYGNELNGGFSFTHDTNSVSFGIKVSGNVLTFKCPYINSQKYYWFACKLVS